MTRGEAGRGNIVALDASMRKAKPGQAGRAGGATILFFTGVRYQRMTPDGLMPPPAARAPALDERRAEG